MKVEKISTQEQADKFQARYNELIEMCHGPNADLSLPYPPEIGQVRHAIMVWRKSKGEIPHGWV